MRELSDESGILKELVHKACIYHPLDKTSPGIRGRFDHKHSNAESLNVIEECIIEKILEGP